MKSNIKNNNDMKRLEKNCYHRYNVEFWKDGKWNFYTAVDTLNLAHESVQELQKADVRDDEIHVERVTYYDIIDTEIHRNYRPLRDEIQGAIDILNEVIETGYIPWTSPAPSSTECCVRNNVEKALQHLENAIFNC